MRFYSITLVRKMWNQGMRYSDIPHVQLRQAVRWAGSREQNNFIDVFLFVRDISGGLLPIPSFPPLLFYKSSYYY